MTHSDWRGSRRDWLRFPGLGLLSLLPGRPLLELASPARPRVLVVVLQRGAVDGLSMVVPHTESEYYRLRPQLAIAPPGKTPDSCLDLDGRFGLHPALAPLLPSFRARELAIVHAVGSPHPTRSHFDAQDFLETGTPGRISTEDGFLNRALSLLDAQSRPSPVRLVAVQSRLPRIVRGEQHCVAFEKLDDLRVHGRLALRGSSFEEMYAGAVDEALRSSAGEAFDAGQLLKAVRQRAPKPREGVVYPGGTVGRRLKQIAQLVRSDVGLRVAVTDCGGWDTHVDQRNLLRARLVEFGSALAAFWEDVRGHDVCLVTASEFGRTVAENGTRGTDHGHGSVMFVLGGGVSGGRVHGPWDGLSRDALFEGRDLPVTTDARDVFARVLTEHLGVPSLATVFPDFTPQPTALWSG